MKFKVFSSIIGFLIILLVIIGGAYYYLFGNSKSEQNTTKAPPGIQDIESFNPPATIQEPQIPNEQTIKQEEKQDNNKSDEKTEIIDEEKSIFTPKQADKPQNPKSIIEEYQLKGKYSRFEPELSSNSVKVYVIDGKALSNYRIALLENMLVPIYEKSANYDLTIFIEMLPNNSMNLSIYNKDIIFSNMKKSYRYVDLKRLEKLKLFFETNDAETFSNQDILEQLNAQVAREEIIKRIKIQGYTDDRGSTFANHILGLSRALSTARYLFPFSEVIEITSLGKDEYPLKDKSDRQRQLNRKVTMSF